MTRSRKNQNAAGECLPAVPAAFPDTDNPQERSHRYVTD